MTLDVHRPVAPAVPVLARPQRTAPATLTPEEKAERQREANRRSYRKHHEKRRAEMNARQRAKWATDPEGIYIHDSR